MEDNKTPRTLSEEELEKVSGGGSFRECFNECTSQNKHPKYENGECTCVDNAEWQPPEGSSFIMMKS